MKNELAVWQPSPVDINFKRLAAALSDASALSELTESLTEADGLAVVDAINADRAHAGMAAAKSAAKSIMGMYPRPDFDEPKAYALGIALVMSEYPRGVLRRVSDPRTGIVRKLKFLPRIAEIVEACDAEMNLRAKVCESVGWILWRRRKKAFKPQTEANARAFKETFARVGLVCVDDGYPMRWKQITTGKMPQTSSVVEAAEELAFSASCGHELPPKPFL